MSRLSLVALLLGLSAAPLTAASETQSPGRMAAAYSALARPAVGGAFDFPAGSVRVGRAELRPAAGVRPRVLIADGRACGLLLDGSATLTYRVEDRFSVPVALRNLKRAPGLQLVRGETSLQWSLAVTGAAVWGFEIPEAAGASLEGATAAVPEWLAALLDSKLGANPERDLLVSDRNGEPGYRWAVFRAQGDDYVVDVDPRRAVRTESFVRLRKVDGDVPVYGGRLASDSVAAQPIDSTWWDARPLDLVTVETDVNLINPSGELATIDSRLRVQAVRDGVRVLPFDLIHRFLDTDGHERVLELKGVTVDGAPADAVQADDDLLILLPEALRKGQTATVEVRTAGEILARPEGNSYWILRTEAWYPKLSGTGDEFSTFRMSVEAAAPFVPFTAGEILKREKTPIGERVVTRLSVPMERVPAVAGKYRTYTREHEGSRLHVSSYANAKPEEAERLSGIVLGVRSCLEQWLGVPSPFQDFQLVEIQDWGWGQAPPGVIFITREAFLTPARAKMDDEVEQMAAWYSRGINERIAHEVAHTWFPHVAKIHRIEENWLSESLSEYAAIECLSRSMRDRKQAEYFLRRKLADWKLEAKSIGAGGSVYLAAHLSGERETDALATRALWYAKGPLVLHAVRRQLHRDKGEKPGEEMFLSWLRSYVKTFTYKPAETRHLVGILGQISGRDWQPWFERYVYGTEMPDVD